MNIIYFPDENSVKTAMEKDEPLIMLIATDESESIVSELDEGFEHYILLRRAGRSDNDLDKYFRIILDHESAEWTFVCPSDYCGITRKEKRIERFFKDGMAVIPKALELIGYSGANITIPRRYRRHFDIMNE